MSNLKRWSSLQPSWMTYRITKSLYKQFLWPDYSVGQLPSNIIHSRISFLSSLNECLLENTINTNKNFCLPTLRLEPSLLSEGELEDWQVAKSKKHKIKMCTCSLYRHKMLSHTCKLECQVENMFKTWGICYMTVSFLWPSPHLQLFLIVRWLPQLHLLSALWQDTCRLKKVLNLSGYTVG